MKGKRFFRFASVYLICIVLLCTGCAPGASGSADGETQGGDAENRSDIDTIAENTDEAEGTGGTGNGDETGSDGQGASQMLEGGLDISGLDEETARQLERFAEAKEQWVPWDYEPFAFGYTACDLDGDGRLELLVQVMAGTGLFSENHFYQVTDSGDGIEELPQEFYEGYSELDIGLASSQDQAFRNGDGVVYYLATDFTRNGNADSFHQEGAYYLKEGCVYSIAYRGMRLEAQDEDSWKETYYDAAGNEISQEDWERLREEFLAGKEEIPYPISWISAYPEEVGAASVEEILGKLAELWG